MGRRPKGDERPQPVPGERARSGAALLAAAGRGHGHAGRAAGHAGGAAAARRPAQGDTGAASRLAGDQA